MLLSYISPASSASPSYLIVKPLSSCQLSMIVDLDGSSSIPSHTNLVKVKTLIYALWTKSIELVLAVTKNDTRLLCIMDTRACLHLNCVLRKPELHARKLYFSTTISGVIRTQNLLRHPISLHQKPAYIRTCTYIYCKHMRVVLTQLGYLSCNSGVASYACSCSLRVTSYHM